MRWRSPDSCSPASISVATPQSIRAAPCTTASGAQVPPLLHGDGRPLPDDRRDVELIHQPSRAGETQTEPARSGVPVLQRAPDRSEEHTSELQSPCNLVCRLLLEKKKKQ